MRIQKTTSVALIAVLLVFNARAQLKFPVTNNDLRNNLQKVITDFPKELNSIKGDVIAQNPQTVEYASLLNFSGAEENTVTQYNALKPIYSWQAVLLNTESFEEASKKYKWLCNQLKVMTVKLDNGYSFSLNGEYDAPDERKKFSATLFKLLPSATNMPKLKVEASMQFEFPEWKVQLLVYEKEREDNERGQIKENDY